MAETRHMRIKLTSDGSVHSTLVRDVETGAVLPVTRVELIVDASKHTPTIARIDVVLSEVEYTGLAEAHVKTLEELVEETHANLVGDLWEAHQHRRAEGAAKAEPACLR